MSTNPELFQATGLGEVERELRSLWRPQEGQAPPVRACMSNLMILCATTEELARLEQEIPDVARAHPSRVLLLAADAAGEAAGIQAGVQAACYLSGPGRKICSEQVTLRAAGRDVEDLPAAVRPLLIGDLPTALWWVPSNAPPVQSGELFDELVAMADHLVFDSRGWVEPVRGGVDIASWAAGVPQLPITDLAWLRLEPYRRLLSEALDPSVAPGALASIRSIDVEHGPHALPKAWLLIGWLAYTLGWHPRRGEFESGVELIWEFETQGAPVRTRLRRKAEGDPEIYRIQVDWGTSDALLSEIVQRVDPERLCVMEARGRARRFVPTLVRPRAELVARDLQGRSGRLLYREALSQAHAMAAVVPR